MHQCTCGNRRVTLQIVTSGQELGDVFCENFKVCPEEERTGVRNDQWIEFLREGREMTAQSARPAGVPWPVTSGLIELQGVASEVEKRRATQALSAIPAARVAMPPVLMPRGREAPASSRNWGLGAMAILFAAGLVGVHAYHETRDQGGQGAQAQLPTASSSSSPVLSALSVATPVLATPAPATPAQAAPTSPVGSPLGPVASSEGANGAEPVVNGSAVASKDQADGAPAALPPRRSSSRRHADRSSRSERRSRPSLRGSDKSTGHDALAKASADRPTGTDALQDALAKAAAASAPSPSAQVLPSFDGHPSGSSALSTASSSPRLSAAGTSVSKPAASGVDSLLSQAAVAAPLSVEGLGSKAPVLTERLSGGALGRLSLQVASQVRQCAQRFGFGRTMIMAHVKISGATGRITSFYLSDRFDGSPVENCSRSSVASLSTPTFRTAFQKLSVPVVVH